MVYTSFYMTFFVAAVGVTNAVLELIMTAKLKECAGGLFFMRTDKLGYRYTHIIVDHLCVNPAYLFKEPNMRLHGRQGVLTTINVGITVIAIRAGKSSQLKTC